MHSINLRSVVAYSRKYVRRKETKDISLFSTSLPFFSARLSQIGFCRTVANTARRFSFQIPMQKIDIKAESKIGSLDNVKHKPGGGDKKIYNDRDYLRQTSSNVESLNGSGSQVCFSRRENLENLSRLPRRFSTVHTTEAPTCSPRDLREDKRRDDKGFWFNESWHTSRDFSHLNIRTECLNTRCACVFEMPQAARITTWPALADTYR